MGTGKAEKQKVLTHSLSVVCWVGIIYNLSEVSGAKMTAAAGKRQSQFLDGG